MKWNYHCCLLVFFILTNSSYGQYYFSRGNSPEPELMWELGATAGAMNCLTDLGGNSGVGKKFVKDINWNKSRFNAGLFLNANWRSVLGVRLQGIYGEVAASDEVLSGLTDISRQRFLRNLHFKSPITEFSLLLEFHPMFLQPSASQPAILFSPYLLAGAGIFYYKPQALINNIWIDLRDLHTEGQGFSEYPNRPNYKNRSWCFPLGVGIKYDPSGFVNLRVETQYRFTRTDYLDDVSTNYINPLLFDKYLPTNLSALAKELYDRRINTSNQNTIGDKRGNPNNKDGYFSFNLCVSLVLNRG